MNGNLAQQQNYSVAPLSGPFDGLQFDATEHCDTDELEGLESILCHDLSDTEEEERIAASLLCLDPDKDYSSTRKYSFDVPLTEVVNNENQNSRMFSFEAPSDILHQGQVPATPVSLGKHKRLISVVVPDLTVSETGDAPHARLCYEAPVELGAEPVTGGHPAKHRRLFSIEVPTSVTSLGDANPQVRVHPLGTAQKDLLNSGARQNHSIAIPVSTFKQGRHCRVGTFELSLTDLIDELSVHKRMFSMELPLRDSLSISKEQDSGSRSRSSSREFSFSEIGSLRHTCECGSLTGSQVSVGGDSRSEEGNG